MVIITQGEHFQERVVVWETLKGAEGDHKEPVPRLEIRQAKTDTTRDSDDTTEDLLPSSERSTTLGFDDGEKDDDERGRRRIMISMLMLIIGIVALVLGLTLQFVPNDRDEPGAADNEEKQTEIQETPDLSWDETPTCNGLASNCNLRVDQSMFAMVNYAMSSEANEFEPFHHLRPLEDALDAGFRGLAMSSCNCPRVGVQLCFPGCEEGYRRSNVVFQRIVNFLQENPREVILVNLEVHDDSLNAMFDDLSMAVQSLMSLLYNHPDVQIEWPTLGDLIDRNERLIVFQDGGPNCAVLGECPFGVHNQYAYQYSTLSDSASSDALMNVETSCAAQRGHPEKASFYVLNHFVGSQLPKQNTASLLNYDVNLQKRVEACQQQQQRTVNLVVVNFWSFGDTIAVVNAFNRENGRNAD